MSALLQQSIDARGIASLTLNRAEVHNAFNAALISDLTAALEALGAEDGVRAVVLTGDGASCFQAVTHIGDGGRTGRRSAGNSKT